MNIKPLVAALAALSLTAASFAAHAVKQQQAQQATQASTQVSAIQAALNGNSYAGYVPHNYINNSGLWLAGFGQMTAAYNTNDLLIPATSLPYGSGLNNSSFTVSLPAVNVMLGYTSDHVGMFVTGVYQNTPVITSVAPAAIALGQTDGIQIDEAYLTYSINDMFGVKAGRFNSDFGSYDPTSALLSASSTLSIEPVTGVEGVFAANGFHGSVAGAMLNGATHTSTTVTNDARPNTVIVSAGYDMPLQGGTVGVEGSYTNNMVSNIVNLLPINPPALTPSDYKAAWTMGAHFNNDAFLVKADVLNQRGEDTDGKTPWVYDGSADYKLGNKFGHGMIVGGYGSYMTKSIASQAYFNNTHWILGAKFGYDVSHYVNATAYLQHAAMQTTATKNNTTAMIALTVKV